MDFENADPIVIGKTPYDVSRQLFKRAQEFIPGGVSTPGKAFEGVGHVPIFLGGGEGAVVQDYDGNQYVDYTMADGSLIFGHAHEPVISSIANLLPLGIHFGTPDDKATALADFIAERHKGMEMSRFFTTASEACMAAVRLARAVTGKKKIVVAVGSHHGYGESFLPPNSPGVIEELSALTLGIPYNNTEALKKLFMEHEDIAAVFLEPVATNMGCIPAKKEFLRTARELCSASNTLLVFDEAKTGFRTSFSSAQGFFEITPDLTVFGGVLGGGMPLAALGGSKELLHRFAPEGDVYVGSSHANHSLALACGVATLSGLSQEVYEELEHKTAAFCKSVHKLMEEAGEDCTPVCSGSVFSFYFQNEVPDNLSKISEKSMARYARFFRALLAEGVLFPFSPASCGYMSLAHTDEDVKHTLEAIRKAVEELQKPSDLEGEVQNV